VSVTRKIIVGMVAGPPILALLVVACFLATLPGDAGWAAIRVSNPLARAAR
jgi:hypothetical protein